MAPLGVFDPDKMTDVQKAFLVCLTDQRAANMLEAADFIADLPQEAKDLLKNADKSALKWLERAHPEDIAQLQYSIKVMEATKLLVKILWFMVAGAVMTLLGVWEKVSTLFKTKT
ncbi:hypothetical protein [Bradyrhizobium sp.]|uniref:hypothetical protein n=1 Tax=Bradyrhizobium sp. TaxID=376 RepID=UPI0025C3F498|nr:hypothetical protein [Bradyrhizobium sp.]